MENGLKPSPPPPPLSSLPVVFKLCMGAVKLVGKAFALLSVHRHELMELRDWFVFLLGWSHKGFLS